MEKEGMQKRGGELCSLCVSLRWKKWGRLLSVAHFFVERRGKGVSVSYFKTFNFIPKKKWGKYRSKKNIRILSLLVRPTCRWGIQRPRWAACCWWSRSCGSPCTVPGRNGSSDEFPDLEANFFLFAYRCKLAMFISRTGSVWSVLFPVRILHRTLLTMGKINGLTSTWTSWKVANLPSLFWNKYSKSHSSPLLHLVLELPKSEIHLLPVIKEKHIHETASNFFLHHGTWR